MGRFRLQFVLLLLLSVILVSCETDDIAEATNRIVYGLTLEPSGIDPHINQSSELGIVLRQVYDTLVYRHPETREIVPGLAQSWEISEDNLSYTFRLRQDVMFHDGTPFNAQAVAANLDRITLPDNGSQKAAFLLGPLVQYDVIDTYTIRLVLSQPFAPLLDSLSQVYLGIASPTALDSYNNLRYQYHQVGTGPFRFIEYTPGDEIILRRNDDYAWGPDFYGELGTDSIDEIAYRFFTDPATRFVSLESGDAQVMGEIVPSVAGALSAGGSLELLPTDVPGMPLQFLMNTDRFPTESLAVRQALIYATNRGVIVDTVYRGFSPVAWGPISRETLYYTNSVEGTYAYDVNQARALLSAAGLEDTNDSGFVDDGFEDIEIVMIVPPWGLIPEVAQIIQDQWREVGIRVRLQQVSGFSALRQAVLDEDYHLVAFDSAGYDPYILNDFYLSNGINNFLNYANPELDSALQTAMQEIAPNTRRALYERIQEFIMEEALILPIRDYVNLNATSPGIDGLLYDPYGWFPLLNNVSYSND